MTLNTDEMRLLTVQEERAAGVRLYRPHTPKREHVGIDWDAITPSCTGCGTKTGTLNREDLCRVCAPRPEDTPAPKTAPTPTPIPQQQRRTPTRAATGAGPGRKRVPLDVDAILEAYQGGQTIPSIAEALQVARPRIRTVLVDAGVELRDDRARGGTKGRRFTRTGGNRGGRPGAPVDEAAIVAAYLAGDSAPTVAEAHGIGPKRVRSILDRHHVERRDDRTLNSGGQPRAHDPALRAEVRRLYVDDQLSRAQVAERLGIPYKTVVTIMNREGIEARQRQGGRVDGASSLKDQIRRLGVSANVIKTWGLHQGLVERVTRGIPSQALVDAYEAAHGDA